MWGPHDGVCELCPGVGVLSGCLGRPCESECGYSGQTESAEAVLIHVGGGSLMSVTKACYILVGNIKR